jgi:hypothetical protein
MKTRENRKEADKAGESERKREKAGRSRIGEEKGGERGEVGSKKGMKIYVRGSRGT